MKSSLCRFTFDCGVSRDAVEAAIGEALFMAECIHGPAKVRLSVSYYMPPGRAQCVLDTSTEVGEQVARIFTGIVTKALGEATFRVERLGGVESADAKT